MADEAIYATLGTQAQVAASTTPTFGEHVRETDRGRAGIGNINAGTGLLYAGILGLASVSISTAGDTTLALKSQYQNAHGVVTVAAGAGAYTRNIILPQSVLGADGSSTVEFSLGDMVELRIEVAASANPTINLCHNASGTILATINGEAAQARNYIGTFRHDGTQWRVWDVRQVNS